MYEKHTKNKLTKKMCGERLLKEYLFAGIIPWIIINVLFAIFLLLALASSYLPIKIFIGLCFVLIFMIDVAYAIKLIKLKKGIFFIKKDRLMRVAKEREYRRKGPDREVTVFYFYQGGRYQIGMGDGSVENYSSIDDEFYLVCINEKKPEIEAIYSCKLYELEEENN